MPTIILLNGVGSAGKSSIANALQSITQQPFLHVEMDAFLEMMPTKYLNHPDGLHFEAEGTMIKVDPGNIAKRALKGMRRAVGALADAGNNLIVDEVIFGNTNHGASNPLAEYQALLKPYSFHLVGVFAELEVLERRECARGDRRIGLAKWQYTRVHERMNYDLSVHTDRVSALECAEHIKLRFNL